LHVRGCCGWSSWSNGCGPERARPEASRHGRPRRRAPQSARLVPDEEAWTLLPEVNRQVAVRWLVVLAARRLAASQEGPAAADPSGEAVSS
jgi:hypothetical protein